MGDAALAIVEEWDVLVIDVAGEHLLWIARTRQHKRYNAGEMEY